MSSRAAIANRGPAAAAANRRALLAAARRLFSEHGYDVALSSVAREAGVGQGSLYRHFPTRRDLALAIFEDNLVELERQAAEDVGPGSFGRLWRRVVELTVESRAFVEVVVAARDELAESEIGPRFLRLLGAPLARAQRAGEVDETLTVDDLAVVQRMLYGVIVTAADRETAEASARRALELVHPALSW